MGDLDVSLRTFLKQAFGIKLSVWQTELLINKFTTGGDRTRLEYAMQLWAQANRALL